MGKKTRPSRRPTAPPPTAPAMVVESVSLRVLILPDASLMTHAASLMDSPPPFWAPRIAASAAGPSVSLEKVMTTRSTHEKGSLTAWQTGAVSGCIRHEDGTRVTGVPVARVPAGRGELPGRVPADRVSGPSGTGQSPRNAPPAGRFTRTPGQEAGEGPPNEAVAASAGPFTRMAGSGAGADRGDTAARAGERPYRPDRSTMAPARRPSRRANDQGPVRWGGALQGGVRSPRRSA